MEISEAGFSAMLTESFEVGDTIEATFELPGPGRVALDAIIRNKNLFRYGFEFVGLDEHLRQEIKRACQSLPIYTGGWH